MKIASAKTLINLIPKKQTINDATFDLFIPTYIGNNAIKKSTIRGTVVNFFRGLETEDALRKRVKSIFAEAINTLYEDKENHLKGIDGTVVRNLTALLRKEKYINREIEYPEDVTPPEPPTQPEFDQLKTMSSEKTAKAREATLKNSILRSNVEDYDISPSLLEDLFKGELTDLSLKYLSHFLYNPQNPEEFALRYIFIDAARAKAEERREAFGKGTALNTLAEQCKTLAESDLKNPGDRWMLCGGYGQHIGSIESLFKFLRIFPEDVRNSLPAPFPQLLQLDKLPNPEEFAKMALDQTLTELSPLLPGIKTIFGNETLSPIFHDNSRALPKLISKLIPHFLSTPMDNWMKEGFLKQISAFLPPDSADILDWIASNRSTFLSSDQRDKAIQELENKISQAFFVQPSNHAMEKLDRSVVQLLQGISSLPEPLLEHANLEVFFKNGSIWLEFIKQANGNLTLEVYASGTALNYHQCQEGIKWPLRITDIDPNKLTIDFFQRMLWHTLEPLKKPDASSRAKDIYLQGTLDTLEGKIAPSYPEEILSPHERLSNELSIALANLDYSKSSPTYMQFCLRLNALMQFCKPRLTGENQSLEIKDAKSARAVEIAIDTLLEDLQKLPDEQQQHLNLKTNLIATRQEIEAAVTKFRQEEKRNIVLENHALVIPKRLLKQIKKLLKKSGLTVESIERAKPFLCSYLGNEVGELFDVVIETLKKDKIAKALKPKETTPKTKPTVETAYSRSGWMRKVVSNTYFQTTYQIFNALWFIYKIYSGSATLALLLTWSHWCLKKTLPAPVYDWYVLSVNKFIELLAWSVGGLTAISLFLVDELKKFHSISKEWQHLLQNWTKTLNATQQIHYDADQRIIGNNISFKSGVSQIPFDLKKQTVKLKQHIPQLISKPFKDVNEVVDRLRAIKEEMNKAPTFGNYLALLNIAENLPIPGTLSVGDFWWGSNEFEAIELLNDLAIKLHNDLPHFKESQALVNRTILAMYSTLTVVDRLVKQCPETNIFDESINAYPLLAFVNGHGNHFDSPELQKRLRDVCEYFMPDINIDQLPTDPFTDSTILEKVQNSLFDYSKKSTLDYFFNRQALPEAKYLLDISKKCDFSSIGIPKETNNETKLNILFNESLVFNRKDPLIPRPFSLLKLHTLLANRIITLVGSEHSWDKLTPCLLKDPNVKPPEPNEYLSKRYTAALYETLKPLQQANFIPKNHPNKDSSFFTDAKTWSDFRNGLRTQSEINISSKGRPSLFQEETPETDEVSKAFESIFVEKNDQPLRFFDFISEYALKLPEDPFQSKLNEPLESALFAYGIMDKHLSLSPHSAAYIAKFFDEQFERMFEAKRYLWCLWLIRIGLRLKPLVLKHNPDVKFPDFYAQAQRIIATQNNHSPLIGIALKLQALSLSDKDPKESIMLAFTRAHFYPDVAYNFVEFNEKYGKWLPEIKKEKEKFYLNLLEDRNIPEEVLKFEFNFETGVINGPPQYHLDTHYAIEEKTAEVCEEGKELIKMGNAAKPDEIYYEDPLGKISVYPNFEKNTIVIKKRFNGIPNICRYVKTQLPDGLLTFVDGNRELLNSAKCWQEETIEPIKRMHIEFSNGKSIEIEIDTSAFTMPIVLASKDSVTTSLNITQKPSLSKKEGYEAVNISLQDNLFRKVFDLSQAQIDHATFWLESTERPLKRLLIVLANKETSAFEVEQVPLKITKVKLSDSKELTYIPNESIAHSLAPITRFCPRKKIHTWASKDPLIADTIFLEPFNVTFKVQNNKGKIQADCISHFPNHHIAEQQLHPSLEGFCSYLLLKNEHGDCKVMFPDAQWVTAGLASFLPGAGLEGSIARALENWMGILQEKQISNVQSFFTFDIDKNGRLRSEDPFALIYLTCLYILQGKEDQAEFTCKELLRIYKSTHCNVDLNKFLFPLSLIPPKFTLVSRIRRKIFAAVEKNRRDEKLKQPENTNHKTLAASLFESFIPIYACYEDLKANNSETQARYKLTIEEEWYLYNHLLGHIKNLLERVAGFTPAQFKAIDDKFGWDSVFTLLGFTDLSNRYIFLRTKFGKEIGIGKSILNTALQAVHTPSSIPSLFSDLPLPASNMGQRIFNDLRQIAQTAVMDRFMGIKALENEKFFETMETDICDSVPLVPGQLQSNVSRYFLTYYAIAKGELGIEKKEKLRSILQIDKGGYSPASRQLMDYLENVVSTPWAFPKPPKLASALSTKEQELKLTQQELKLIQKILQELKLKLCSEFIETIHSRCTKKSYLVGAGNFIYHTACHLGFSQTVGRTVNSSAPSVLGFGFTTAMTLTNLAVQGTSKIINAVKTQREQSEKNEAPQLPVTNPSSEEISFDYNFLQKEDDYVDSVLDNLFTIAFEEKEITKRNSITIDRFQSKETSTEAFKEKIKNANESLDEYHDSNNSPNEKVFQYKGKQFLCNLHTSLLTFKESLQARFDEQISIIHAAANPEGQKVKTSFEIIKKCLLNNSILQLGKEIGLSPEESINLEKSVLRYAVLGSRLNQMIRILTHFDKLNSIDTKNQRDAYRNILCDIASELKTRRTYRFDNIADKRLLKRFVLLEFLDNILLWDKQTKPITESIQNKDNNYVQVVLPSLGKSKALIPLYNSYWTDGKHITFDICPEAISGPFTRDNSRQGSQVYDLPTNILDISRKTSTDPTKIHGLKTLLHSVENNQETISATPAEIQTIELLLIDYLERAERLPADSEFESCFKVLQKSNTKIYENGILIADEIHELSDPYKKLIYSLGPAYTLPKSYYLVMEMCIQELLNQDKDSSFTNSIRSHTSRGYPKDKYNDMALHAAEELSNSYIFELTSEQKQDFIQYVSGIAKIVPAWIKEHPMSNEITMAKGTIATLIPHLLSLRANVDYGPNKQGCAISYGGNMHPLHNLLFKSPFGNTLKNFFIYLHSTLTHEQATQLWDKLKPFVASLIPNATPGSSAYNSLKKMLPEETINLIFKNGIEASYKKIIESLQKHPQAGLLFVRFFISNQVVYWKRSIPHNFQNLFSMFKKRICLTGTPYNPGTYHPDLHLRDDSQLLGEMLEIVGKKCNGISKLEKDNPTDILNECLKKYFRFNHSYSMLLDGDAQLYGLDNNTVVDTMITFCNKYRKEIKGIISFKEFNGKDQLVCTEVESKRVYPFDQCKFKPEEYLTYIDDSHDFGVDIPQSGSSLILGGAQALFRFLQQVFRLRNIKKFMKLFFKDKKGREEALNLLNQEASNNQKFHLAMTENVRSRIINNVEDKSMPNLKQFLEFAISNEADLVEKAYYLAYVDQIYDIVRKAITLKRNEAPNLEKAKEIHREFREFFAPEMEDLPVNLFLLNEVERKTEGVIKVLKKRAKSLIEKSNLFTAKEKGDINDKIDNLKKPPLPAKTTVLTDGKYIYHSAHSEDLDSSLSVENETDLDIDIDVNVQTHQTTPTKFSETPWKKETLYNNLDWLTYSSPTYTPGIKDAAWSLVKTPNTPPFFKFINTLQHSRHPILQSIDSAFSPMLWFTNNFIPRIVKATQGEPVDVGSKRQLELNQVLVILEKKDDKWKLNSVGCLSQHEADTWQELAPKNSTDEIKYLLYDVPSRTVAVGDDEYGSFEKQLKKSKKFNILEAQLKFLNGDENFTGLEEPLKNWLSQCKGLKTLHDAYFLIHDQRKTQTAHGSIIDNVFCDLRNIPLEYRI